MDDKILDSGAVLSHKLNFLHKAKWFPSQSAAQRLSFVQYHSLDIIALLISSISSAIFVLCFVFWKCSLLMQKASDRRRAEKKRLQRKNDIKNKSTTKVSKVRPLRKDTPWT